MSVVVFMKLQETTIRKAKEWSHQADTKDTHQKEKEDER